MVEVNTELTVDVREKFESDLNGSDCENDGDTLSRPCSFVLLN